MGWSFHGRVRGCLNRRELHGEPIAQDMRATSAKGPLVNYMVVVWGGARV